MVDLDGVVSLRVVIVVVVVVVVVLLFVVLFSALLNLFSSETSLSVVAEAAPAFVRCFFVSPEGMVSAEFFVNDAVPSDDEPLYRSSPRRRISSRWS